MTLQPMFISLDPDETLEQRIYQYKSEVRELVGDQLFLADPPHLTVYLSVFADEEAVVSAIESQRAKFQIDSLNIVGWHIFEADSLNGNNTLVCQIDDLAVDTLRRLQSNVISTVSNLRDTAATCARFEPRWQALTEEQRSCVTQQGFPYVGDGWHPHFTIASIRQDAWAAVEAELIPNPPQLTASCPSMTVYRLVHEEPEVVRKIDLT